MNPLHYEALQHLRCCTFQVGSYDKRFVRDVGSLGEYDLLTPKQEAEVERLTFRYRRQLAGLGYRVPQFFKDAIEQRRLAAKAAIKTPDSVKYHWAPEQKPEPVKENPQLPLLELP